uniref:response regulator n=1 Tax=Flavobacterium sp. TaxID=239 RepID=UPI00404A01C6
MEEALDVFVIDNDPIYQLVTKKLLTKSENNLKILPFLNGEDAFLFIKEHKADNPKIILLDLDMPIMDGWDFLEAYYKNMFQEKFNDCIYIVSSSIALEDKNRVKNYPVVKGHIEKPLSFDMIESIIKCC